MSTYKRFFVSSFLLFTLISVHAATSAPNFTLPTRTGTVDLLQLRGKVVYLDFWASWCAPCRKSFPWMNKMHRQYKNKDLVIIAVNLDKNKDLITEFLEKTPAEFTIAFDPQGKVASAYQLMGMPSSYIIGRSGFIINKHVGFRNKDVEKLEAQIIAALAN